eukprot:TRINITY_DN9301_c0_g1_i3.p1 TRINITY_DN9301_c0_g1~~TRINITY_DN9301_c0_g1_i3.p1  ORF type:complete len:2058 (-),score=353.44 TRINITY_DN9301_c0_g1_i3:43-6216(-)
MRIFAKSAGAGSGAGGEAPTSYSLLSSVVVPEEKMDVEDQCVEMPAHRSLPELRPEALHRGAEDSQVDGGKELSTDQQKMIDQLSVLTSKEEAEETLKQAGWDLDRAKRKVIGKAGLVADLMGAGFEKDLVVNTILPLIGREDLTPKLVHYLCIISRLRDDGIDARTIRIVHQKTKARLHDDAEIPPGKWYDILLRKCKEHKLMVEGFGLPHDLNTKRAKENIKQKVKEALTDAAVAVAKKNGHMEWSDWERTYSKDDAAAETFLKDHLIFNKDDKLMDSEPKNMVQTNFPLKVARKKAVNGPDGDYAKALAACKEHNLAELGLQRDTVKEALKKTHGDLFQALKACIRTQHLDVAHNLINEDFEEAIVVQALLEAGKDLELAKEACTRLTLLEQGADHKYIEKLEQENRPPTKELLKKLWEEKPISNFITSQSKFQRGYLAEIQRDEVVEETTVQMIKWMQVAGYMSLSFEWLFFLCFLTLQKGTELKTALDVSLLFNNTGRILRAVVLLEYFYYALYPWIIYGLDCAYCALRELRKVKPALIKWEDYLDPISFVIVGLIYGKPGGLFYFDTGATPWWFGLIVGGSFGGLLAFQCRQCDEPLYHICLSWFGFDHYCKNSVHNPVKRDLNALAWAMIYEPEPDNDAPAGTCWPAEGHSDEHQAKSGKVLLGFLEEDPKDPTVPDRVLKISDRFSHGGFKLLTPLRYCVYYIEDSCGRCFFNVPNTRFPDAQMRIEPRRMLEISKSTSWWSSWCCKQNVELKSDEVPEILKVTLGYSSFRTCIAALFSHWAVNSMLSASIVFALLMPVGRAWQELRSGFKTDCANEDDMPPASVCESEKACRRLCSGLLNYVTTTFEQRHISFAELLVPMPLTVVVMLIFALIAAELRHDDMLDSYFLGIPAPKGELATVRFYENVIQSCHSWEALLDFRWDDLTCLWPPYWEGALRRRGSRLWKVFVENKQTHWKVKVLKELKEVASFRLWFAFGLLVFFCPCRDIAVRSWLVCGVFVACLHVAPAILQLLDPAVQALKAEDISDDITSKDTNSVFNEILSASTSNSAPRVRKGFFVQERGKRNKHAEPALNGIADSLNISGEQKFAMDLDLIVYKDEHQGSVRTHEGDKLDGTLLNQILIDMEKKRSFNVLLKSSSGSDNTTKGDQTPAAEQGQIDDLDATGLDNAAQGEGGKAENQPKKQPDADKMQKAKEASTNLELRHIVAGFDELTNPVQHSWLLEAETLEKIGKRIGGMSPDSLILRFHSPDCDLERIRKWLRGYSVFFSGHQECSVYLNITVPDPTARPWAMWLWMVFRKATAPCFAFMLAFGVPLCRSGATESGPDAPVCSVAFPPSLESMFPEPFFVPLSVSSLVQFAVLWFFFDYFVHCTLTLDSLSQPLEILERKTSAPSTKKGRADTPFDMYIEDTKDYHPSKKESWDYFAKQFNSKTNNIKNWQSTASYLRAYLSSTRLTSQVILVAAALMLAFVLAGSIAQAVSGKGAFHVDVEKLMEKLPHVLDSGSNMINEKLHHAAHVAKGVAEKAADALQDATVELQKHAATTAKAALGSRDLLPAVGSAATSLDKLLGPGLDALHSASLVVRGPRRLQNADKDKKAAEEPMMKLDKILEKMDIGKITRMQLLTIAMILSLAWFSIPMIFQIARINGYFDRHDDLLLDCKRKHKETQKQRDSEFQRIRVKLPNEEPVDGPHDMGIIKQWTERKPKMPEKDSYEAMLNTAIESAQKNRHRYALTLFGFVISFGLLATWILLAAGPLIDQGKTLAPQLAYVGCLKIEEKFANSTHGIQTAIDDGVDFVNDKVEDATDFMTDKVDDMADSAKGAIKSAGTFANDTFHGARELGIERERERGRQRERETGTGIQFERDRQRDVDEHAATFEKRRQAEVVETPRHMQDTAGKGISEVQKTVGKEVNQLQKEVKGQIKKFKKAVQIPTPNLRQMFHEGVCVPLKKWIKKNAEQALESVKQAAKEDADISGEIEEEEGAKEKRRRLQQAVSSMNLSHAVKQWWHSSETALLSPESKFVMVHAKLHAVWEQARWCWLFTCVPWCYTL